MGIQKAVAYQCTNCGVTWLDKACAEKCCMQYHCRVCGVETPQYLIECRDCHLKLQLEEAKLVEWDGKVFYDPYSEEFFHEWSELFERRYNLGRPVPEFVFACYYFKPTIDIDYVLDSINGDSGLEEEVEFTAEKELRDFINIWNAKQSFEWYFPDHTRKIQVPKEC